MIETVTYKKCTCDFCETTATAAITAVLPEDWHALKFKNIERVLCATCSEKVEKFINGLLPKDTTDTTDTDDDDNTSTDTTGGDSTSDDSSKTDDSGTTDDSGKTDTDDSEKTDDSGTTDGNTDDNADDDTEGGTESGTNTEGEATDNTETTEPDDED